MTHVSFCGRSYNDLTVPSETQVNLGLETPPRRTKSQFECPSAVVRCQNFNFIIKVFFGSELVQGTNEMLSHHETS